MPLSVLANSWYQAEKNGFSETSLSQHTKNLIVIFKDDYDNVSRDFHFVGHPEEWHIHKGYTFDYFILRSHNTKDYFKYNSKVEKIAQFGYWQLYKNIIKNKNLDFYKKLDEIYKLKMKKTKFYKPSKT